MKVELECNPWFSILSRPRQTIREIINKNSNHRLFILSFLYGISGSLLLTGAIQKRFVLDSIFSIIAIFILSPLMGYLLFSIQSWFLFLTGKLLKGMGKCKEIRAVIAWSNVPVIFFWFLVILLISLALFFVKQELLQDYLNICYSSVVGGLGFIAGVWFFIIYINALAEVQGFSSLRAFFNIILASILGAFIFFIFFSLMNWKHFSFFEF